MVSGMTDLDVLLRTLHPMLRDEEYVYATVDSRTAAGLDCAATVVEDEGVTVVLRRDTADDAGLAYDFVAGWITLSVESSLEAVGLTAAFATALGEAGISCNVLAGFHHDHILVPTEQRERALSVLQLLSK